MQTTVTARTEPISRTRPWNIEWVATIVGISILFWFPLAFFDFLNTINPASRDIYMVPIVIVWMVVKCTKWLVLNLASRSFFQSTMLPASVTGTSFLFAATSAVAVALESVGLVALVAYSTSSPLSLLAEIGLSVGAALIVYVARRSRRNPEAYPSPTTRVALSPMRALAWMMLVALVGVVYTLTFQYSLNNLQLAGDPLVINRALGRLLLELFVFVPVKWAGLCLVFALFFFVLSPARPYVVRLFITFGVVSGLASIFLTIALGMYAFGITPPWGVSATAVGMWWFAPVALQVMMPILVGLFTLGVDAWMAHYKGVPSVQTTPDEKIIHYTV